MPDSPTYEELAARVAQMEQEALACRTVEDRVAEATSILEATLEATADAIVVVDLQGRIVNFNQRFEFMCDLPDSLLESKDDNLILAHLMNLVKDPELFLEKVGQIYDAPDLEDQDIVEFKDGRIFRRVSLPQVIGGRTVGRVWSFQDITESVRSEEQLRETLHTLRKALGGTIQAIAMTVEKKDPYTAGHQQRVADLARAIATELGLSRQTIDGIRLAGSIHDLGKTAVPADILSKPGKLTEHEFGIIKCHPEVGYDILKEIQFPWPIAETVLQHHERLDGTGYPRGLKGDEIILEAKILMVADVIEAISSHRPYRPALGIEVAINEIQRGKGKIFAPNVVEACLNLLTKKNFQFRFSTWNKN